MAGDEEAPAPTPEEGEEAPPAEGELTEGEAPLVEGEEGAEPPPPPKRKPKFFVHWNRRKARFYDYNFDYGESYYHNLVNYLGNRQGDMPPRLSFAERGLSCSLNRKNVPDIRTQNILTDVRNSIRGFEAFQRNYILESQKRGKVQ